MNEDKTLVPKAYGEVTDDDESLLRWANEGVRNSTQVMYESLRQLVILVTALLGGSVAFFKDAIVPDARAALVFFLLVSLGASVWGIMPQEIRCRPEVISDARSERDRIYQRQKWCLRIALSALILAAISAFFGVIAMPASKT